MGAAPALIATAFVFGLVIGSFLNVVISRVPNGQSLMGRSACPRCHAGIRPRDNIPVVGWLLLRGRCRDCGLSISRQYPIVEASTAVLFAAVTAKFLPWLPIAVGQWVLLGTLLYFAAASVALFVIDWQTLRLPNAIVYPTVVLVLVGVSVAAVLEDPAGSLLACVPVLAGAAAVSGAYGMLWLLSGGRAIGFGDVKLALALGAVTGYFGAGVVLVGVMSGWVIGALIAAIGIATGKVPRGKPVPFGPSLLVGTWVALFLGPALWSWYAGIAGL